MRDVIEQRHVRGPTGKCVYDGDYWPCDARTLLDRSDPAAGLAAERLADWLAGTGRASRLNERDISASEFAARVTAVLIGEPDGYGGYRLAATPTASPTDGFRFTTWDGTSLVVTVDAVDPGDMGEPRSVTDYDDGPTTYLSVRAVESADPAASPTATGERE